MSPSGEQSKRRRAAAQDGTKRKAGKRASAKRTAAQKATGRSAAKKPAAKKPAAKKPATKKPAAKKPVAKKPAAKRPATKKPAAKKPATTKPAAKKPAAKKPAIATRPSAEPPKVAGSKPVIDVDVERPKLEPQRADGLLPWDRRPGLKPGGGNKPEEDVSDDPNVIFDKIKRNLPIALFPVRLETRFVRRKKAAKPHLLRIRIFPDPILVDAHDERLTAYEAELGRAYWSRCFESRGDKTESDAARAWLVDLLDEPRARWVALQTRPSNAASVGDGVRPRFPKRELRDTPVPSLARLLPDRWVAQVRTGNEWQRMHLSEPVDRTNPLVVAPQLADMPDGSGAKDFLSHQGLAWRHNFGEAVTAGMAMEIPVVGEAKDKGFSELIVFGVMEGNRATDVDRLFHQHRYGQGWRLVPQGMPTNNTDAGRVPPLDPETPEFEASARRPDTMTERLEHPADLYTATNEQAAALTFGLRTTRAFDGEALSDRKDGEWSEAITQTLWAGLHAELLDRVLAGTQELFSTGTRAAVRDFAMAFVRGRALLPTLSVDHTPYGLLPVTSLPYFLDDPGPSFTDHLASMVSKLEIAWVGSDPAAMTPTAVSGEGTDGDEAVEVGRVLGAVPHPTAFRLRAGLLERDKILADYAAAEARLASLFNNVPVQIRHHYLTYLDRLGDGLPAYSHERRLKDMRDFVEEDAPAFDHVVPNESDAVLAHLNDVMIPMLEAHGARSRIHNLIMELGTTQIDGPSEPDLYYINYEQIADDAPTVSVIGDPDPEDLKSRIEQRLDLAAAKLAGQSIDLPVEEQRSLLFALIDLSIEHVVKGADQLLVDGLTRLRDLIVDEESHDPPAIELERLATEAMGLFTHRIDAWRTGLAAMRLAEMRTKQPSGVQVGCYGWVVDLLPDDGQPDTDGFIHAPSLDHAATAAVLRSAWRGLGQSLSDTPFAVNLTSDRVRRAHWLLGGLRNGHDLDDLLGQRLERRLHDEGLDRYIDDIRTTVLTATGHGDQPAAGVVDGLAVATAYRTEATDVYDALELVRQRAPVADREPLKAVLNSTEGDFDAAADLLMADGVLSLIQSNLDGVGASMAAVGSNPTGIPETRIARVEAGGHVVTHRVMAVLEPTPYKGESGRDDGLGGDLAHILDATLENYLRNLLPPFEEIEVRARLLVDGKPTADRATSLGGLGISATHLIAMCPSAVAPADGPLAQFVGRSLFGSGDVAVDLGDAADIAVVAGAIADALVSARPLRPGDLVDATAAEAAPAPTVDVAELRDRANAVAQGLHQLAETLDGGSVSPRILADLALCDFGAAVQLLNIDEGQRDKTLAAVVDRLLAKADQLAAIASSATTDTAELVKGIKTAVQSARPLTTVLSLPDDYFGLPAEDVVSTGATRIGRPDRARAWMLAAGRVHDGLGALDQAALLSEALADRTIIDPHLVQYPISPESGDGWAAVDLPDFAEVRSRLCLFSVTDPEAALESGRLSGLLFDAWTEPIPDDEVTTGVAVNFDSPSSRAPNAVLLAVPPENRRWSAGLMVDTLRQTLIAGQNRAVGPETLQSYGHVIPSLFLDQKAVIFTEDEIAELLEKQEQEEDRDEVSQ